MAAAVVASIAPVHSLFAEKRTAPAQSGKVPKLRFAIVSDGHYGQPGTEYKLYHEHIVQWLNESHDKNPLHFVVVNGDLVHDRPDLLPEVKKGILR